MISIKIGENEQNQRLDRFLKKYLNEAPLSYIYKAIRKDVKVNGKRASEDTVLNIGDEVTLYIKDDDLAELTRKPERTAAKRQFKIAYEDDNIIAVEKPFGLLTHGDKTEKKNHLANQVVDYLIEQGSYNPRAERTFTPAPVNRLDRNTTGLVLFGKNNTALQELNRLIREKDKIEKFYLTIVCGRLTKELHLKDKMIKDCTINKITVLPEDAEGREMETIVRPLKAGRDYSLAEVEIVTGRSHQIRAHLAKAHHPVIGDVKYGDRRANRYIKTKFGWNTQLLHAYKLVFGEIDGPLAYLSGKTITAQPPEDFARIEEELFSKNSY